MRFLAMACAVALLMAAAPHPARAAMSDAVTTADVNMRSGPGTGYPVIATLPQGSLVAVNACLPDRKWCDITWRNRRGWVFAAYLAFQRRVEPGPWVGGPVILYDYGDYSDRYRRHRKNDRDRHRPRKDWPRADRPHHERPHHKRPREDWRGGGRDRHDRRPRPNSGSVSPTLPGVGEAPPPSSFSRTPGRTGVGGDRFRERPNSGNGGGCDLTTAGCGAPRRERRGSISAPESPPTSDGGRHERRRRDHSAN